MPRENNGRFLKGNIPWNKGRKGYPSVSPQTTFKKGHLPQTTRPIGSEWIDGDGYVRVKVCNDKNKTKAWRLKHHLVYESHHPGLKINPHTHRVLFLDGDKRNFDIDNLALVTLKEQLQLIKLKMPQPAFQEEGKALINIARIQVAMSKRGYNPRLEYQKEYNRKHREELNEYHRQRRTKNR